MTNIFSATQQKKLKKQDNIPKVKLLKKQPITEIKMTENKFTWMKTYIAKPKM